MSKSRGRKELPYEARARIADNLLLQRRRAEYSQGQLAELARVSASQIRRWPQHSHVDGVREDESVERVHARPAKGQGSFADRAFTIGAGAGVGVIAELARDLEFVGERMQPLGD